MGFASVNGRGTEGTEQRYTDGADRDACSQNTRRGHRDWSDARVAEAIPRSSLVAWPRRSCEMRWVSECPFCARVAAGSDIIHGRAAAVAFPDDFPVSEGHVLVVPRRHLARVEDLAADEWAVGRKTAAAGLQFAVFSPLRHYTTVR